MVKITERASEVILESLQASGIDPDMGLRLMEENGEFSLDIDSVMDDDHVIEYKDCTILIVEKELEEVVGDVLIDITDTPDGAQLTMVKTAKEDQQ